MHGRRIVVIVVLGVSLPGCRVGARLGREDDQRSSTSSGQPGVAMNAPSSVPERERIDAAVKLMTGFAQRTGLSGEAPERRYLWTDAFAVCNFLSLAQRTGDRAYSELALRLVDHVHQTLGRHRSDEARSGWLSGPHGQASEQHPTRAGLRIGKPLPERAELEPLDERLEWDRDGQYFHYLIQWMHALDQVARFTGDPRFNLWARELADTAFRSFTYVPRGGHARRMYWKMSVDLSRPLVTSMGQHDPLDGSVVYAELEVTAAHLGASVQGVRVGDHAERLAAMVHGDELATSDALGLGGLLIDANRMQQLAHAGVALDGSLLESTLAAALLGLRAFAQEGELRLSATRRLAFRELGLAIGLHGVELMAEGLRSSGSAPAVRASVAALGRYVPLAAEIESFWRDPEHRRVETWTQHGDINDVMLATSLVSSGFLVLGAH